MANSFIPVDQSKALGSALVQLADSARSFGEDVAAIQSVMAAMNDATDYSTLEAQFGLPAGKGADVSYLIASLKAGLDGVAQFRLLPDWLGRV